MINVQHYENDVMIIHDTVIYMMINGNDPRSAHMAAACDVMLHGHQLNVNLYQCGPSMVQSPSSYIQLFSSPLLIGKLHETPPLGDHELDKAMSDM